MRNLYTGLWRGQEGGCSSRGRALKTGVEEKAAFVGNSPLLTFGSSAGVVSVIPLAAFFLAGPTSITCW